jgi:type II secretory pathway pseudopilin PulG
MSDSDEFIIEEDEGPSNRPFLVAAGSLLVLLIVSMLCLGAVRNFGLGNAGTVAEDPEAIAQQLAIGATATAISATNEAIAAQNELVTQTIVALTATAAAPTSTPTPSPSPTNTPTMTPSPLPTETPVVDLGEGEEGEEGGGDAGGTAGDGLATATPNLAATEIFSGLNTATPVGGGSGGSGGSGGTGGGSLPETGIPLWGAMLGALGLLLVLVGARRLRTGG